jgi:hypothetical protein
MIAHLAASSWKLAAQGIPAQTLPGTLDRLVTMRVSVAWAACPFRMSLAAVRSTSGSKPEYFRHPPGQVIFDHRDADLDGRQVEALRFLTSRQGVPLETCATGYTSA